MFVKNQIHDQISMFNNCTQTPNFTRAMNFSANSWVEPFREVLRQIDEEKFACLYSLKGSRPNTPTNIVVGALMVKHILCLSDDELLNQAMTNNMVRYALHLEDCDNIPLSDKSLQRFRAKVIEHEIETGKDLLSEELVRLFGIMADMMGIQGKKYRIDSTMADVNCKYLTRFTLILVCTMRLAKQLHKSKFDDLLSGLERYTDSSYYNRVTYHSKVKFEKKQERLLKDVKTLLTRCDGDERCKSLDEYLTLKRVQKEQLIQEENGELRLRTKEDGGMDSHILQTPCDPEATYTEKNGEKHRGYKVQFAECVEGDGTEDNPTRSLIRFCDVTTNTGADTDFLAACLPEIQKSGMPNADSTEATSESATTTPDETQTEIVADAGYSSEKNRQLAKENGVDFTATALKGQEVSEHYADCQLNADETAIEQCPAGHCPLENSYQPGAEQITVTMEGDCCRGCPYCDKCHPKFKGDKAEVKFRKKTIERARQQRYRGTEEFREKSEFRNGVEAIASLLKRKYGINVLPVRGLARVKQWIYLAITAINFQKLGKYCRSSVKRAQIRAI